MFYENVDVPMQQKKLEFLRCNKTKYLLDALFNSLYI